MVKVKLTDVKEDMKRQIEEQRKEEILEAMEDYKKEYEAEYVNPKSQKFIRFFYKWKQKRKQNS